MTLSSSLLAPYLHVHIYYIFGANKVVINLTPDQKIIFIQFSSRKHVRTRVPPEIQHEKVGN